MFDFSKDTHRKGSFSSLLSGSTQLCGSCSLCVTMLNLKREEMYVALKMCQVEMKIIFVFTEVQLKKIKVAGKCLNILVNLFNNF